MSELIKTKEGKPFKTEKAAKLQRGLQRKKGIETKVVESDEGWALEVIEHKKRPKRIPVGTRNILSFPKRPGYVRRLVTDIDDRILQFEQAGYEVVKRKDLPTGDPRAGEPSQMGMPVTKDLGAGMKGVLMEQKQEWYDEDQKLKQDKIKADELSMKRTTGGIEDGYGEIKISATR